MSATHPGRERLEDSAGNGISRGGRAAQPHGKGSVATIGISTTSEIVTDNKKKTPNHSKLGLRRWAAGAA